MSNRDPLLRSAGYCLSAALLLTVATSAEATVAVVTAPGPDQLSYEVVDVFAPRPVSESRSATSPARRRAR